MLPVRAIGVPIEPKKYISNDYRVLVEESLEVNLVETD
jgi:hypothetical protein